MYNSQHVGPRVSAHEYVGYLGCPCSPAQLRCRVTPEKLVLGPNPSLRSLYKLGVLRYAYINRTVEGAISGRGRETAFQFEKPYGARKSDNNQEL
jgi:hypothetical protein